MEQGVRMMECAGADYLHCDVMDGVFVPNISFGFQMISRLHDISDLPLDVHLMIVQPERYIERFAQAGADFITVHAGSDGSFTACIETDYTMRQKPGVVLNPATPLEMVRYILDDVDMIFADVGKSGLRWAEFYSRGDAEGCGPSRDDRRVGQEIDIEVDGGVDMQNCTQLRGGRCDRPCRGSAVFGAEDPALAVRTLRGE